MKKLLLVILSIILISMNVYADDEPSIWAVDFVDELDAYNEIEKGMFTEFQSNITRQEFVYLTVKMIEIINNEPITIDSSISFTDTNDTYALKGASVGITSGIGNGQFGPDLLLTREQMATLLKNTLSSIDMTINSNQGYQFKDEDTFSSWAKDAIYLVKANGIMDGIGNDQFNATGNTTKEAAMVVVTKLIRKNIHNFNQSFMDTMNTASLDEPTKINNTLEVTMEDIVVSSKPSVNTVTFSYKQKNISSEPLAESSLRVFFNDGSSELIKGFSKYFSPGTTKIRSLSLDYSKSKTPLFVIIETSQIDINLNLHTMEKWIIK